MSQTTPNQVLGIALGVIVSVLILGVLPTGPA
jgi:tetrahydromethanopterin S-methyltransferase subunit F